MAIPGPGIVDLVMPWPMNVLTEVAKGRKLLQSSLIMVSCEVFDTCLFAFFRSLNRHTTYGIPTRLL